MDSLVTFQVVVAAERLHALVALEGTLGLSSRWVSVAVHHMLSAVVLTNSHARNHGHLATWLVDVGHDRTAAHANRVVGISVVRSHGLAMQTTRVVGAGGRGQRRRLVSAIRGEASLGVSGRGSIVAGVAGCSRAIRVLHLATGRGRMRLGGRHDGSVRRSSG